MKQVDYPFPLPYYTVNRNFTIQTYSKEAFELAGVQQNLLDIIDPESHNKLRDWVSADGHLARSPLEINLVPLKDSEQLQTADVYLGWDNDLYAQVMILVKDKKLAKVTHSLQQLRTRLEDTNFELMEKKEELEKVIEQNNHLSAPFIKLTNRRALVPLFGNLTQEKMNAVSNHLLSTAQKESAEVILFDFTAVGEVNKESIEILIRLMTSLFYMGGRIVALGVKPEHAKLLHREDFPARLQFMNSVEQALIKDFD
ncbi:STAS domain-containing protein [Halobacillus rhizosphaerae]|uniref:STAS domain-containing protein n=1 Tax=Halobacillus rhizosphaerae TaxID=3064889 RepID=UPI00398AA5C0